MSDTLRYEQYRRPLLGGTELRVDEWIEVLDGGEWRAGYVRFERHWRGYFIGQPSRYLWQWDGLPARRIPPTLGAPPAR